VAHAFPADAGEGHLHATTVTDGALVLDALELSAGTFPVLRRAENTLAEKTAFLRLERPVVDRFRVFHFAAAPRTDRVGVGNGDADMVETVGLAFKTENFVEVGFRA